MDSPRSREPSPFVEPEAGSVPFEPELTAVGPGTARAYAPPPGGDFEALLGPIVGSARRLGVELSEPDARDWLAALRALEGENAITVDPTIGVYGHRLSLLDFDPTDLPTFRWIGQIVGLPDQPGIVTALAISGSAAQGRVQGYPGDCDFFERVHITAPSRELACARVANVIRDHALHRLGGPGYRLIEVKFGSFPEACLVEGRPVPAGGPISWRPSEVTAGQMSVRRLDGRPATVTWAAAAAEPGWCKLDWIVAHPGRGHLVNVSNMLDVTWEAPDGSIVPLDGFLDPYFQEVYLEAETIPIFSRLVDELAPDALARYVAQLEHEIHKYAALEPNYGKVARRAYNVFRLTGRHADALFVRELFDEPATALYRVWALLDTLDEAKAVGLESASQSLAAQADELIESARAAVFEDRDAIVVTSLTRAREVLGAECSADERVAAISNARTVCLTAVNRYFGERLRAIPSIWAYIEAMSARAAG